jgi:hypothetical protein
MIRRLAIIKNKIDTTKKALRIKAFFVFISNVPVSRPNRRGSGASGRVPNVHADGVVIPNSRVYTHNGLPLFPIRLQPIHAVPMDVAEAPRVPVQSALRVYKHLVLHF